MNRVLQRFVVRAAHRPIHSCVVYAFNSTQAAENARSVLCYMLGHNPKMVYVYSAHEDGSADKLLTRYAY